ncbi:uncharacterized protein LOC125676949 isoform X2 [Ostrea edulis]|uniref:uncharacterized protein LOC125676949 isoform X2 n=1 Tax=Ostrea edulis TaxID=37623 RepID=UPI0020956327|nr:uncharacterized protein LOC125676949 isoform X2 [Ostrea edulis]
MTSNGTSTSSSDDGLAGEVIWVITFLSTSLLFGSMMMLICCDAYKKYNRRVPREYITGRGNYPRQDPSAPSQGTTVSNGGTQSNGSSNTGGKELDRQTDKAGEGNGGHAMHLSSDINMPSGSKKKSDLPPIDAEISTISGSVPEEGGVVNAGFTDKPLPSIHSNTSGVVLTPVTNLNLGI